MAALRASGSSMLTTWPARGITTFCRFRQAGGHDVGGAEIGLVFLADHDERGDRDLRQLVDAAGDRSRDAAAEVRDAAGRHLRDRARRVLRRGQLGAAADCGGGRAAVHERLDAARLEVRRDPLDLREPARLRVRVLEARPRVDQHQRADALGMTQREVQRQGAAERESGQHRRRLRRAPIQHAAEVVEDEVERIRVGIVGRVRVAVPAIVPEQHAMAGGDQRLDLRAEVLARGRVAAREHDRRTVAVGLDVEFDAVARRDPRHAQAFAASRLRSAFAICSS